MADEREEYTGPKRRASDGEFVETVKRADSGLQTAFRFVTIIVILIGFGVTIGTIRARSDAVEAKVDAIGKKVDGLTESNSELKGDMKATKEWQAHKDQKDDLRDLKIENLEIEKRAREIAKKGE